MSGLRSAIGKRMRVAILAPALALFGSAAALAQDFTVNSTTDAADATAGDGICADTSGRCTLRAAIQTSNQLGGNNTITLPAGTYPLNITGAGEDLAATGDLDIDNGNLVITGAGATTTIIDGGALDRVFDVAPSATTISVTISNVTIRNGVASGAAGGAVRVNLGTVTLNDCNLSGNGAGTNGGAISNAGTLTINRCTISANTAGVYGGGLYNAATATVTNTTMSGNSATSTGGGLYNAATASVAYTTIAFNSATTGGGVFNSGTATLSGTLLAANTATTGGNCNGPISSAGSNLDGGTSCAFAAAGDLSSVDPLLGALANNGGPTSTHALSSGSPAIDAGSGCPATDQRGVARPVDGNGDSVAACDIGAYEATTPVDLAISVQHQKDCVKLHDHVVYTIVVTNNGPGTASNVTVTDSLPDSLILVSVPASCTGSGNALSCAVGTLNPGGSATLTVDTTAETVAAITNSASVQTSENDVNAGNNTASVTTRINCAVCFLKVAFGSASAPQVQQARAFRDRYLMPYAFGRSLVDYYYRHSPTIAELLRQHDDLRAWVRAGLTPVIAFARLANEIPQDQVHAVPATIVH